MQNQLVNTKGLVGKEGPQRINRTFVLLIMVALVVAMVIGIATNMYTGSVELSQAGAPNTVETGIAVPQTTFSTQQYWDLAAEHAASNAPEASAQATFSTQQYWDLAAEHAAQRRRRSAGTRLLHREILEDEQVMQSH